MGLIEVFVLSENQMKFKHAELWNSKSDTEKVNIAKNFLF